MPTATFAQLCQTLTEVEEAAGIHVFDLYHDVSYASVYPFTQHGDAWDISQNEFLATFYGWGSGAGAGHHGNGIFRIDCSGGFVPSQPAQPYLSLDWWKVLDYPFSNPVSSWAHGALGMSPAWNSADLITLVPNTWALDLSNNSTDCWTSCSYMNILKELLVSRNLCNYDGCQEGQPCCSLNASELAAILNQQDVSGGFMRTSYAPDPFALGPVPLAGGPVAVGDHLILAVLFKNDHIQARDIELRLHFHIT